MAKTKRKDMFSALLIVVLVAISAAGCYLVSDYLSVGITLFTGGLSGILAMCVSGVVAGSSTTCHTQ